MTLTFVGECIDQGLATRIMSGVRDAATRKRLLTIRPFPSLEMAVDICRSDENGKTNDAALTSSRRQFNQVRKRPRSPTPAPRSTRYDDVGQTHRAPKRWRSPTPPRADRTCGRCGGAWHATKNDCPAFEKACLRCGHRGHFSRLCRTRESGTFRRHGRFSNDRRRHQSISNSDESSIQNSSQVRYITLADVCRNDGTLKAPQITVEVLQPFDGTSMGKIKAIPDSGAEASVIGVDELKRLGLEPQELCICTQEDIRAANGQKMKCIGTFPAEFKLGNRFTTDDIFVFLDVQGSLLS